MSGRKLRTFVCVDGPHGMTQFGPRSDVPEWAVKLITNPAVWEEEPAPEVKAEPKKRAPRTTKAEPDDSGDED